MSIWKHVRAVGILPFSATIIIPALVTAATRQVTPGWGLQTPFWIIPVGCGSGFILLGLYLVVQTVRLFASIGQGTLAPWHPTQKLVVVGIYRHVRNPMISGVSAILLGEALLLGSPPLVGWFLFFLAGNMVYIRLSEERGLVARFGEDYELYRRNVPAWIPRLSAWDLPDS